MQTGRASRAIVVDIVDWDLRHAELVEYTLAAGAVAIAVAGDALFHIIVIYMSIHECFDAGFETEFCVLDCAEVRLACYSTLW